MLDKPSFSPWLANAAPWLAFVGVGAASVLSGGREPMGLLVVLAFPVLLLVARLAGGTEPLRLSTVAVAWWLIPMSAALSMLAGPAPQPLITEAAFLSALGCALALVSNMSRVDVRRLLIAAVSVGSVVLLLAVLIRYAGMDGGSSQLEGTFYNTNALAGILLVLLGPALWVALGGPERRVEGLDKDLVTRTPDAAASRLARLIGRGVGVLLSLGILWALYATASRASVVALAAALILSAAAFLSGREGIAKRVAPWVAALPLAAVAAGVLVLGILGNAASGVPQGAPQGTPQGAPGAGGATHGDPVLGGEPRVAYWSGAIALWMSSPIVGHGSGSFAREFPAVQTSVTGFSRDPHSRLMEALAETGILGLTAFLFVWFLVFRRLWRLAEGGRDLLAVTGLFVAGAFFVHGSLDLQWGVPVTPLAALLIIGATLGLRVSAVEDETGSRILRALEGSVGSRIALGVIALAVLSVAGLQYASATQLETAVLKASAGDSKGGVQALKSSASLDPTAAKPHLFMGQERLSLARRTRRDAGGAAGGREVARRIDTLVREAHEEAQLAVSLDPLDPSNHILLSDIAAFEAETAKGQALVRASRAAERFLAKAYRLDEWNRTSIALRYGESLRQKGARNEAEKILGRLTGRYTKEALGLMHSWFGGGLTREQLERRTEGSPVLRQELGAYFDAVADISLAHQSLAAIAVEEGRTEDAVQHAKAALELEPGSADAKALLDSIRR